MGIVVIGAVFVDIKGYPLSTYIPGGRNAGRIEQVHGGVSRNVAEDIANVELRPTFVGLVDDTGMGIYSGDGRKLGAPAENYAYRLYYTRVVNGVKCLVNEGKSIDDMSDGIPWPYETVCFTVDRRGLQLCWESPLEIIDTVHTDPVLKPFSEILNTFESMMKIKFEDVTNRMTDGTGRMDITIDTMQLGLVRVREKDGDGLTGLLVPAWIFYGNNRIISEDGFTRYDYSDGSASSWNKEPFPMLVINAVDGTIIDLSNGY